MARRSIVNNEFTFTWEIHDFNFHLRTGKLKSPFFNVGTRNITSWYLSFFDKADSLRLVKKGAEDCEGDIGCKIAVFDQNGETLYSTVCDKCLFSIDEEENERYKKIANLSSQFCSPCLCKIIVRCVLILPESITDLVFACKARTKIETEKFSFQWNVKKLAAAIQVSKEFRISQTTRMEMTLTKDETYVTIFMKRLEDTENILVVCKVGLLQVNGFVCDSRTSERLFRKNRYTIWQFPSFIKTNYLFPDSGKYVRFNTFSLVCVFSVSEGAISEELEYCPDDKSVLNIPNAEGDIRNLLNRFKEDGNLNNWDYISVGKFLIAATEYKLPNIERMCTDFLMSNLNCKNVCDILVLSDKVFNDELKDSAINFIVDNANSLLTMKTWSQLIKNNNTLVTDVIQKVSKFYAFYKNI